MRALRLSELEDIPIGSGGLVWKPLRHALGIEAFGANAFTAQSAGDEVVEEHDELSGGAGHHEELYVVVAGRATFEIGGQEVDAPAGTCLFLDDPAERRGAVAREPGTTILAIGGARGEAYRVSPWEFSFRAGAHAQEGRIDEALGIMQEGLERYPEHPSLLYNLACFESLGGRADDALDHLARALELDGGYRAHAATDPDLDPIRSDPRFPGEAP